MNGQKKLGLATIAIAIVIMLIAVAAYFYAKNNYYISKEKPPAAPVITQTPTKYTAVFKGFEEGGAVEKWRECKNIDCISSLMKNAGASSDAIAFTKFLYEFDPGDYGYLSQFQENGVIDEGKIDLGAVTFPNRANANEARYLLNGSPAFVPTEEIFQNKEIINEMKQDPLYSEAKNKYPKIDIMDASSPQFVGGDVLPNNSKRFIFRFELENGCRACDTEYFANIGFDFDSSRKFLGTTFLQIIKIIVPEEKWETFESNDLGFSIKYPQMIYNEAYSCSPKEPRYVPLKVFEDKENGIAYITAEFYYDAPHNSDELEPCEKIAVTLESLRAGGGFYPRAVKARHISNDTDLNKFIKDNYFSRCSLESKELWKQQDGVYEIKLNGFKDANGNDTDLGSSVCPVNYEYKILYSPEKNKAMSINLGQECGFGTDPNAESYKCYDEEMIDSFRFE